MKKGKNLGIFTVDDVYKVKSKGTEKYKNIYASDCMKQAQAEPGCNFFMYSHEYPIMGCWCCEEAHTQIAGKLWDIYHTC